MIEGKNLTKVYERSSLLSSSAQCAVSHIDISVANGETVAIVGESGSGKSTLVKLLSLEIPPTEGEIYINGERIDNKKMRDLKKLRRKFQMIPQNPYDVVDPHWTLECIVAEPMKIAGYSQERIIKRVDELFTEVNLSLELRNRYPYEISGGELQRIVLARALSLEPEVLICDEATAMLDVSVQAYIMSVLRMIQNKRNLTLILITHDLVLADLVSDRVYVIKEGKIVESGKNLLQSPQSEYTKKLISAQQYTNL